MPTTTPRFGLTKPDLDIINDVWGSTVNVNYDLIDAAAKLTELVSTSGSLQTQIDAVEASDVDSVNSVTGAVTIEGIGEVFITTVGQIITVSGRETETDVDGITTSGGATITGTIDIVGSTGVNVSDTGNTITIDGQGLQSQIDAIDKSVTLQEAYDSGDGTISTSAGKPVVLTSGVVSRLLSASGIDFNTVLDADSPANIEGRVFYNTTEHALTVFPDIAGSSLQVGQEFWIRVKNNTGSTISDGKSVYINGSDGELPTVALAHADNITTARQIGLATHSIPTGTEGFVTSAGKVRDVDTSSFSAAPPAISTGTPEVRTTGLPALVDIVPSPLS